jgi:chromate reductase, NAD(P)H dehydrogenase (quinone)
MTTPIRVLGIAGSLRHGSHNRAARRAATELALKGATVETFELDGIPPFNQDEEQNPPAKVTELKRRIREADAILFVTLEYNWSVSGVLKNAIDWASRPHGDSAWNGKPVAIMGTSTRAIGNRACAKSSAADSRVSQHVPNQPARSTDQPCHGPL